jgi:uncharacterized protein (UPF0332 family)
MRYVLPDPTVLEIDPMASTFELCKRKEKIVKEPVDPIVIDKERKDAEQDLKYAKEFFNDEDMRRAIQESYYAILHSLRGAVLTQGYRAKSQTCLRAAVEELFVKKGKLQANILPDVDFAFEIREGLESGVFFTGPLYSIEDAREMVTIAERIVVWTKDLK